MIQEYTIATLSVMTAKTREIVKKRLDTAGLIPIHSPHGGSVYESPAALAAIYEVPEGDDPAALTRAKIANLEAGTRLRESREAQARAELIPRDVVARVWGGMTLAAREQLLSLPHRLAANCQNADFFTINAKAMALVHEVLENLSRFNPADYLDSADATPKSRKYRDSERPLSARLEGANSDTLRKRG